MSIEACFPINMWVSCWFNTFWLDFAKIKGKDVFADGTGGIGAFSTAVAIGHWWFVPTLLLDFGKGLLIYQVSLHITGIFELAYLIGIAGFLGHRFPIYLRFKGDCGYAMLFGVGITSLYCFPLVVCALVWLVASFKLSRQTAGILSSLALGATCLLDPALSMKMSLIGVGLSFYSLMLRLLPVRKSVVSQRDEYQTEVLRSMKRDITGLLRRKRANT